MAEEIEDLSGSEVDKVSRCSSCSTGADLRTWTSILHIFLAGAADVHNAECHEADSEARFVVSRIEELSFRGTVVVVISNRTRKTSEGAT